MLGYDIDRVLMKLVKA